jgi:pSer/pThr/pTyr-binding forkhead associated (FHA) protein
MRLFLTLFDGEKLEYPLKDGSFIIGRSNRSDLVIPHEGMSRQHCKIDVKEGEVFITDLGSINGVFIDGQRIPPNKSMPFYTYLNVSFGHVQSAHIEEDDDSGPKVNPLQDKKTSSQPLKTSVPNSSNEQKTKSQISSKEPPSKTKKEEKKKSTSGSQLPIRLISFVIALLALYWFLYHDKPSSSSEEPVAAPAATNQAADQF